MDQIRFIISGEDVFIHVDDLKNAIRVKNLEIIKQAQIGSAEAGAGPLAIETVDIFQAAAASCIRAIDDAAGEAIRTVQAAEN